MNTYQRNFEIRSASTSGPRQLSATIATSGRVAVWSARNREVIDEILLVEGVEIPGHVPLLTDHARSIQNQVGCVENIRADGGRLEATLRFSEGESADHAWDLYKDRLGRSVSVGYQASQYVDIPAGQSREVNGKSYSAGNRPLRVTSKWALREVSLVPIGADQNAMTRAANIPSFNGDENMTTSIIETMGRDVQNATFAEFATAALRSRGQRPAESDLETGRSWLETADGMNDLSSIVNAAILDGYRNQSDSTAGWAETRNVPNYLLNELAALTTAPTLERVGRGERAPSTTFEVSSSGWRLGRYGASFAIDEQDLEDTAPIGAYETALRQIGAAARRLLSDLAWATVLGNPTLGDDVSLFDSSRGNTGTAILGADAIKTAMAAIAGQTLDDGEDSNAHVNLGPKYLIVPPALAYTARSIANGIRLGDGSDLIVRSESRLSSTGFVSPVSGQEVSGNGANWLLAAPASQAPSIIIGTLFGNVEPRIRHYRLSGGQWGVGFDVELSAAASAIDGKPLYFSTGAGA